jgi:hydrogenase-4 component B
MSLVLVLIATALAATSGLPGLLLDRNRPTGQWIAAVLMGSGALLGLIAAGMGMRLPPEAAISLPFPLVSSQGTIGMDSLSAVFLVPIYLIGGLGPVYGLAYWRQCDHSSDGHKLCLFWGLLVAGMATLVLARHAFVFLLGWEVMALASFFLITTEDHLAEARSAGWLYLVATHVGTLSLFAMFCLLRLMVGSFSLRPIAVGEASLELLTATFFLALLGFGLKAGVLPLHFWLPGAHASAPSHVSALLSGVVLKMGIYGLVRITGFLPEPLVAWGSILLILGAVGGVVGVVFAIGQHDLKRLLAYHSVENIGIILMGLGLAMIGRSTGRTDWIVLGLAGCLLHVWNHSLFKSLLFLSAGSVVHATHTREIDRLGGLARSMPWTAAMFLVGAVAICGLPPLNGFVSELFIYLGLLRTIDLTGRSTGTAAAAAIPALAMIGALALACFVKAYGAVFLGTSRSEASVDARESPPSMILPMGILAACCLCLGLAPIAVAPALDHAVATWIGSSAVTDDRLAHLAPLTSIGIMGLLLLAMSAGGWILARNRLGHGRSIATGTWDCGYALPGPRMQYTSSSFAQMLVRTFRWLLQPRTHRPEIHDTFASPTHFESHIDDIVLDRQLLPAAAAIEQWVARLRRLQRGLTQQYVLYILVTVIVMMVWTMPMGDILARLFSR